jgi:hypothetical protein
MVWHVARLAESRSSCRGLVGKPERKSPLKHLGLDQKNNIEITLVDLQLDAQNSCLFTYLYNTFIKILYMFRALPCSFYLIFLFKLLVPTLLSLVGDPLSGNGCDSPNHINILYSFITGCFINFVYSWYLTQAC